MDLQTEKNNKSWKKIVHSNNKPIVPVLSEGESQAVMEGMT